MLMESNVPKISVLIPDCSMEIIRKTLCAHVKENGMTIRIVEHKTNRGTAATRNTAMSYATGKYTIFIDSDDYILPGAYTYFKKVIKNENCDILTYGCVNVYEDSSEKKEIETNNYQDK